MILRIENDEKYAARRNSIYFSALVSMKHDTGVLSDCLQSTVIKATRSDIVNFRVQVIQFLDESPNTEKTRTRLDVIVGAVYIYLPSLLDGIRYILF